MSQSTVLQLSLTAIAFALLTTACGKAEPVLSTPSPSATSVGTDIDDSVMTTTVKIALLGEATLKSMDITVQTHKGEVQLSGFVDDLHQIGLAEKTTRGVAGVKVVDNKLMLKVGAPTIGDKIDDAMVTARVKAAFTKDDGIKGVTIAVETHKGEVILSGLVDSHVQIDRAVILARTIDGVNKVRNNLVVKQ